MFIEPAIQFDRRGWIEVICGSMFSGKTEELIRRLRRARIANLRVGIFKPSQTTGITRKILFPTMITVYFPFRFPMQKPYWKRFLR